MLSPSPLMESVISSGMFLTSTTASNYQTLARAFTSRSVPPASGRARSPCSVNTATASSTVLGATYANGCKRPLLSSVYSDFSSWQHWNNSMKTGGPGWPIGNRTWRTRGGRAHYAHSRRCVATKKTYPMDSEPGSRRELSDGSALNSRYQALPAEIFAATSGCKI